MVAVVFSPILAGGCIAPLGKRVVCITPIDVPADVIAVTAGTIAAPYPAKAAVAVTLIGIAASINPLAAIAGGNNILAISHPYK